MELVGGKRTCRLKIHNILLSRTKESRGTLSIIERKYDCGGKTLVRVINYIFNCVPKHNVGSSMAIPWLQWSIDQNSDARNQLLTYAMLMIKNEKKSKNEKWYKLNYAWRYASVGACETVFRNYGSLMNHFIRFQKGFN